MPAMGIGGGRFPVDTRLAWATAGCLVFAAATLVLYADVLRAGPRNAIAVPRTELPASGAAPERFDHLWTPYLAQLRKRWEQPDHRFAVWVVAHNARKLVGARGDLFGPGPCFPFLRPLALGHPALTQGLLAAPAWLATGDPLIAYNTMLVLTTLLGALAVFLLVRSWTGEPAAGIAAGLLYAFHGSWTTLATFPYIADLGWTVFALYWGERAFRSGHTRDVVLAGASIALQLSMSLYASLVGVAVLLPYGLWLLRRHGPGRLPAGVLAATAGAVTLLLALVYAPYLDLPDAGAGRPHFAAVWAGYLPGRYLGWIVVLAAGAGLLWRDTEGRMGRVVPLALSCALLLVSSVGGLPGFVPGAELARGPAWLAGGVHLVSCLLAGLGVARLLGLAPARGRAALAVVLLALVFVDTLWPEVVTSRARGRFQALALRPSQNVLDFFSALEAAGNDGPLLELPQMKGEKRNDREAQRMLLQAYHQRPTASCYNSLIPPATKAVRAAGARAPEPAALARLAALGFTTTIVYGTPPERQRFVDAQRRTGGPTAVRVEPRIAAWSLLP